MIITIHGKRIAFIHIPKNAGSSIEGMLTRLEGERVDPGKNAFEPKYLMGYRKGIYYQHLTYNMMSKIYDMQEFDFIFATLRDPIDRFVSEFNWSRKWMKGDVDSLLSLYPSRYSFRQTRFQTDKSHFTTQEYYLRGSNVSLCTRDVTTSGDVPVHVYQVEDLSDLKTDISDLVGEDIIIPTYNSSHQTLTRDQLTYQQVNKIKQIFDPDYQLINTLFPCDMDDPIYESGKF